MRELTPEEVKQIQLQTLNIVDKFCQTNNIKYTLAAGTLIGAVRHKGYIPWDDDIDIYMLRKEYNRFVAEFSAENYEVYTHKKYKDYTFPFAKVSDERTILNEYMAEGNKNLIGVNIDIFPVDNIPNNEFRAKLFMRRVGLYRVIADCKRCLIHKQRNFLKNCVLVVIKTLTYPLTFKWLCDKTERVATKYLDQECNSVGNIVFGWGSRERCPNIGYDKHIYMEFEGGSYPVISSYDTYLTNVFGDYMTPPPVEKQVTHHVYAAYQK